jgi:putative SOS response-associated peptidase YedK
MLTTAPGPDVAPIHDRQVVVLRPEDWRHWLHLTKPEADLLRPLPAGSLAVEEVRSGSD